MIIETEKVEEMLKSINALVFSLGFQFFGILKCNELKPQTFLERLGHDAYLEYLFSLVWGGIFVLT